MMTPERFYAIIFGHATDFFACGYRILFTLVEPLYAVGIWWRNRIYDQAKVINIEKTDSGSLPSSEKSEYHLSEDHYSQVKHSGKGSVFRIAAPVISVGNLTLGGTGKTPCTAWLAQWLTQNNIRVCIISRGYKTTGTAHDSLNDEGLELKQRLPGVTVLQNADRVTAADYAVNKLKAQVILLDDGFQHRRLYRDLNIVLLDATAPLGNGHLFPRGILREGIHALDRAQVVVLTRCNLISEKERALWNSRIIKQNPHIIWTEAIHEPNCWINSDLETLPLNALEKIPVLGFCGIGNPQSFFTSLNNLNIKTSYTRIFQDHWAYSRNDIIQLGHQALRSGAEAIICTRKDLVKLACKDISGIPLYALDIQMRFTHGLNELEEYLHKICHVLHEGNYSDFPLNKDCHDENRKNEVIPQVSTDLHENRENHYITGKYQERTLFSSLLRIIWCIWCIPREMAVFLVRIYQWTLSPFIGRSCRFHPTCSNYYILAVRKYGFIWGSLKGAWRILRCNPFCKGGEDEP